MRAGIPTENLYPEVENRLRPLAEPLEPPRPGDRLAEHREKGQPVTITPPRTRSAATAT